MQFMKGHLMAIFYFSLVINITSQMATHLQVVIYLGLLTYFTIAFLQFQTQFQDLLQILGFHQMSLNWMLCLFGGKIRGLICLLEINIGGRVADSFRDSLYMIKIIGMMITTDNWTQDILDI